VSETEIQAPINPPAHANNPVAAATHRAQDLTLHNSRLVCGLMFLTSIASAFIGICMFLIAIPLIFPVHNLTFMRALGAAQWALGGVAMMTMCPALWKWTRAMLHKCVKLDARGVDFQLGTTKNPAQVFLPWDQISSVQQKRVGSVRQFTITAQDGSYAQFNSSTFFRPKRVARLVAGRAGLTIQQG